MRRKSTRVSAERIAEELRQLLVHPRRSRGIALLFDLGLIEPLLPELSLSPSPPGRLLKNAKKESRLSPLSPGNPGERGGGEGVSIPAR